MADCPACISRPDGVDPYDYRHNGCFYYPKLYIECPNILASMYAQKQLKDHFQFQILGGRPHETDRFVVVGPPYGSDEKPLILSGEETDYDNWIDMFDALRLIVLTENKFKP